MGKRRVPQLELNPSSDKKVIRTAKVFFPFITKKVFPLSSTPSSHAVQCISLAAAVFVPAVASETPTQLNASLFTVDSHGCGTQAVLFVRVSLASPPPFCARRSSMPGRSATAPPILFFFLVRRGSRGPLWV